LRGTDRLTFAEPHEVRAQVLGRLVAAIGDFANAPSRSLAGPRDRWVELRRRRNRTVHVLTRHFDGESPMNGDVRRASRRGRRRANRYRFVHRPPRPRPVRREVRGGPMTEPPRPTGLRPTLPGRCRSRSPSLARHWRSRCCPASRRGGRRRCDARSRGRRDCAIKIAECDAVSVRPPRNMSASDVPSTNSMTMKYVPLSSPSQRPARCWVREVRRRLRFSSESGDEQRVGAEFGYSVFKATGGSAGVLCR